jgi:tetratricopeptide (TPR) repeat protein
VKTESGGCEEEPGKELESGQPEARTCPICGTKFVATTDKEFCPVCILRGAFGAKSAVTGESDSVAELAPASSNEGSAGLQFRRFEHYEVMLDEDGEPIELGRGAMGVTYKALDVDLQCPVTLKVISERYLGDESARLRFLREARAAASVRHPNVASVFHLGRADGNYFYAMEFVEGETLEHFIKRSGRVEVKLALEIVTQVATGLAAVHKQKLVHRDIKPSNIMVSVDESGSVTAKIIDLGLAKPVTDVPAEAVISMPGAFAGTPEFASPEQFAGVGVDIRSDLYSLGITLWEMVTGKTPFRGTTGEVMYQHLHAPLPLERLRGIPQPIVAVLEALLEKDPRRRLQSPTKFLEAMPIIIDAIKAGRSIIAQSFLALSEGQLKAHQRTIGEGLSAYDLYLRGMALMELLDPEVNQKAGEFFKRATELEPDFALGYVGLACFFLEQEGFCGEKRLLDSAVQSARRAIALDPFEVRNYTTLARAYYRKGWYSQCDEALQKALEVGPNDDTANALAGISALSKHQFIEGYNLFRKAHRLNPKETWRIYYVTEILYRGGVPDLAERWMQRALDQETSPHLRHLMECYQAIWRRRFTDARTGFLQLPPETHLAPRLQSTVYSVSDGLLYCAIGLEDWPEVVSTCNARLNSDPENFSARTYLALALGLVGQPMETQEIVEEVLQRGLQCLQRPAQPDIPWDVHFHVAWAYRCVGQQHEAYDYLNRYLIHRTFLHLPFGLDNPLLVEFKKDPEFNANLVAFSQKLEIARQVIREQETAATPG